MSLPIPHALLSQIDWQPLWKDHGIPLAIMGLVVVFFALIFLCVFIATLPRVIAALEHLFPETVETAPAAEMAVDELSEDVLAVITAVVATTVTQPHRIVSTRIVS